MTERPQKFEARTAEQMKALSNKLRITILNLLGDQKPRSNKQIALELGYSPTKTHYHIRELEKTGLIEVVETRQIGGIVEKCYLPIAINIYVLSDNREEVIKSLVMEYLDLYLKLENGSNTTAQMNILHLTPHEKSDFESEMKVFYQKWMEKCGSKTGEDGETWRFMSLLFPNKVGQ